MAQKLFVGGLSFNTTNDALTQYFAQAGTVVSANVVTDQMSGRSRGFGFVEMSTPEEAKQAIAQLNGREFEGRRLTIDFAKPKTETARSGGFGGGRGGWR